MLFFDLAQNDTTVWTRAKKCDLKLSKNSQTHQLEKKYPLAFSILTYK